MTHWMSVVDLKLIEYSSMGLGGIASLLLAITTIEYTVLNLGVLFLTQIVLTTQALAL